MTKALKRLDIDQALTALRLGHVLAYPTEAVYGLGCDPFNQQAVTRLLAIKGRPVHKGLIVLIAHWAQLSELIADIPQVAMDRLKHSWPGPHTWIFPKSHIIPDYLSGEHESIAIRMTAHPVAKQLCQGSPLVSTSANYQTQEPARSLEQMDRLFADVLEGVVMGALGSEKQPSAIHDVLTGERLR